MGQLCEADALLPSLLYRYETKAQTVSHLSRITQLNSLTPELNHCPQHPKVLGEPRNEWEVMGSDAIRSPEVTRRERYLNRRRIHGELLYRVPPPQRRLQIAGPGSSGSGRGPDSFSGATLPLRFRLTPQVAEEAAGSVGPPRCPGPQALFLWGCPQPSGAWSGGWPGGARKHQVLSGGVPLAWGG